MDKSDWWLATSWQESVYLGAAVVGLMELVSIWRLGTVLSAVSLARLRFFSWKRHLLWCIRANDREFMTPSSLSMAPKPVLQAKVVFHALIALAITMQLPSWAYVAWATYSGGQRLSSVPATLYFLQLAAEPLLFVAFALVVDMWFGAGQFFPERTLRLWRNIVLLCSLVYSGILAYVVTKEFADRTAAHVAASLACKIYVLYSAAVLLLLALSFLISGMIVQHRVRAVLMSYSPSASRMARVRVFLVMVICLSSFTLRSMDVAHLIYHNFNYQERFMRCERLLCYSRWLPEISPLLVLLYMMRPTVDDRAFGRTGSYQIIAPPEAKLSHIGKPVSAASSQQGSGHKDYGSIGGDPHVSVNAEGYNC